MADDEGASTDAKEIEENNPVEIDWEDAEFLERLWSFGEGYFDFSTFEEIVVKKVKHRS